jgi:hypothetical protein
LLNRSVPGWRGAALSRPLGSMVASTAQGRTGMSEHASSLSGLST